MDLLETLFRTLLETPVPTAPAYRESQSRRVALLERIQQTMDENTAETVAEVYADYVILENYRFFRYGLSLGLELLRLERPPV